MWAKVVKPLAAQAATPPPAVKPAEPIALPPGLTPEDTFKGAQARYQKRDFRGAASEARLALSVWERQGADRATLNEARYFIANACSRAGDYEASLREYDRLLKADPQNPVFKSEASNVRGQMHKAGRQKAQAELQQARAYFTGKDYARAVASARSALMLGEQHQADKAFKARCSSLIGRSYYRQGSYSEAAAALKQAVTLNPADSEARAALNESRRQIELANEQKRARYTYAPQDFSQPAVEPARTTTRKSYPTASSSYPKAPVTTDPYDQPKPDRKRPRSTYNPDYSVPGTKYTPREPQLPTVSGGSANPGGLPSYSGNRDSSLPSYSSGSARSGTLPTYDSSDGGVYPGYQNGSKGSGAPPGY
jgi:tetratricopeptide (TPR) repeat protein